MKKKYLLILNFLICVVVNAQTAIDKAQTFGEYSVNNGYNTLCLLQSDGKFVTTCNGYYNGNPENSLIRFKEDGSRDNLFDIGSGFTIGLDGPNSSISSICIQPDNKILASGDFTYFNGKAQKSLIRLNSDGTKDLSFDVGAGVQYKSPGSPPRFITLQPDGKILMGGGFISYDNNNQTNIEPQNSLIRLNSNGTKDTTFDVGTGFYGGYFGCITVQTDGKILVGGSFTSYKGITVNGIIRLNSDGSIDPTFNIGIGFNSYVSSIKLQIDGKVLVAGDFTTYDGLTQNRLVRLNTDGTKDTSFDVGIGFSTLVLYSLSTVTITPQPDGKIIIDGPFTTYNGVTENGIIRLNQNGSIDTSFNAGSAFTIGDPVQYIKINLQQDNKIIAYGNFTKYNNVAQNGFVRINTDGSKDESFLLGSLGFNGGYGNLPGVLSLFLQSDGKLLVGGGFTYFNGITENKLIRFNSDGKKDTTFDIKNPSFTDLSLTGFDKGSIFTIAVQSDGKIIVGGDFRSFNSVVQNRIIRLNTDGTKDNSFNIGTGITGAGWISSIVVQSDNKILVGSGVFNYNGLTKYGVIRLNSDGSIDTSFNTSLTIAYSPVCIALQKDGKIIVGRQSELVRLNSDGTKDNFFNIGSGLNGFINKISIQSDNKILIAGSFTTYNGLSQVGLIRFNPNGTKDTTFNVGGAGFGTYAYIKDIAIQSDQKIIICGIFNNYNGITQQGLIRLMPDGSFDDSFFFGDSTNSCAFPYYVPTSIAIKNNGIIFVGGDFRNYFNYASSGLVGIRGNAMLSKDNFEVFNNNIILYPNPVKNNLYLKSMSPLTNEKFVLYDSVGKILSMGTMPNENYGINVELLSKGIYFIKLGVNSAVKFIKE